LARAQTPHFTMPTARRLLVPIASATSRVNAFLKEWQCSRSAFKPIAPP
jgi:hypothetical protein